MRNLRRTRSASLTFSFIANLSANVGQATAAESQTPGISLGLSQLIIYIFNSLNFTNALLIRDHIHPNRLLCVEAVMIMRPQNAATKGLP